MAVIRPDPPFQHIPAPRRHILEHVLSRRLASAEHKGKDVTHPLQLVTSLLFVFINTNSLTSSHVCFVEGLPYSLGTLRNNELLPKPSGVPPPSGTASSTSPAHTCPQQSLRWGPSSLSTKCVNHLFTCFSCLALGVLLAISFFSPEVLLR